MFHETLMLKHNDIGKMAEDFSLLNVINSAFEFLMR